jgi:hypothetical protein
MLVSRHVSVATPTHISRGLCRRVRSNISIDTFETPEASRLTYKRGSYIFRFFRSVRLIYTSNPCKNSLPCIAFCGYNEEADKKRKRRDKKNLIFVACLVLRAMRWRFLLHVSTLIPDSVRRLRLHVTVFIYFQNIV